MSRVAENPVHEALRARRVTRRMGDEPVDPATLDLVLHASPWAPNAGNRRLQPVRAVTDPALIRLLKAVSPGMVPLPEWTSPEMLVCLSHPAEQQPATMSPRHP